MSIDTKRLIYLYVRCVLITQSRLQISFPYNNLGGVFRATVLRVDTLISVMTQLSGIIYPIITKTLLVKPFNNVLYGLTHVRTSFVFREL